ncbi:MAG: GNAT family N-acetyltransferase [Alphaproteobacteria bacterium]|nr:GNAT family N-acetyltransferase [Alphaproteobacteria bacterium]
MALMRSLPRLDPSPHLIGPRVELRYPQMSDFEAWARVREQSRAFLTPWEPTWSSDELSRASFRRRIKRYQRDARDDIGYAFFILARGSGALMGGCNLTNVRRGVAQTCSLGYWMGAPFAGKRLMTEAVSVLIPFIFERLNLHRVEAACLPENQRSRRLLARLNFTEEGVARQYLRIDGVWRDHLLFGLLDSDRRGG